MPATVMPSHFHEALLLLFRNRPELAATLLRDALHVQLPEYTEARIESAELTDIQPAEYRADLVVLPYEGTPVLGIVIEAQLGRDERKRFVWPVYGVNLRARIRCPVRLFVVTADEAVARWAAQPIDLGGGNRFTPLVLGPAGGRPRRAAGLARAGSNSSERTGAPSPQPTSSPSRRSPGTACSACASCS